MAQIAVLTLWRSHLPDTVALLRRLGRYRYTVFAEERPRDHSIEWRFSPARTRFSSWTSIHDIMKDSGASLSSFDAVVVDSTLLWKPDVMQSVRCLPWCVLASDISSRQFSQALQQQRWTKSDLALRMTSCLSMDATFSNVVDVGPLSCFDSLEDRRSPFAQEEQATEAWLVRRSGRPFLIASFGISDTVSTVQAEALVHSVKQHDIDLVLAGCLPTVKQDDSVLQSSTVNLFGLYHHPYCRGLVCQGGQKTMFEALLRHIPLVILPLKNEDQFEAARALRRSNCAWTVPSIGWNRVSTGELERLLENVLDVKSPSNRAMTRERNRVRTCLLKKRYETGWISYVQKHLGLCI